MTNIIYYKVTNQKENHHGYQYKDGLNILPEKFNDDPNQSCCSGGFYFTTAHHIFNFIHHGIHLREIMLPDADIDFKMVMDQDNKKWRANKIILGKRYNLTNPSTFDLLVEKGVDINKYTPLCWAAKNGHLNIVKYLVEKGADIHTSNNDALCWSAHNGHLNVVQYLVDSGANIYGDGYRSFYWAAENGHLSIVKLFINYHNNICVMNDMALLRSAENGHIDVVKYMVENGADIDIIRKNQTNYWFCPAILTFLSEHN